MVAVEDRLVEYATATYILPGQPESGDHHVVVPLPDGLLMAVIDGLGHGHDAAQAAKSAVACIKRYAHKYNLVDLLKQCHKALDKTRGAVMNFAKFDFKQNTVTWLGVGNVSGRLMLNTAEPYPAQQELLLRPGVVGQHIPALMTSTTRISHGDVLIFATDGIDPTFSDNLRVDKSVENIAGYIKQNFCRDTDDALIVVIRYLGGRSA